MVALLLKTSQIEYIMAELMAQFGPNSDSPDFFDNDALVIDFSYVSSSLIQVNEIQALIQTLQGCRLKPLAYRSANPDIAGMALALGLVESPYEAQRNKSSTHDKMVESECIEVIREVVKEVVREVPGPVTLVIDKQLRSGQKIYARGADLIMLAMVNQGAEVVADGNIHVYAPLRGKAMAGASGNINARIFSLCMEPELISIAGIYRTSEHALPADIKSRPAQVRLSNDGQDKLLIEALTHL